MTQDQSYVQKCTGQQNYLEDLGLFIVLAIGIL